MKRGFDYYIFVDYSENLIGYTIIDHETLPYLLPKLIKFRHFRNLNHKRTYIFKIKRIIEKEKIDSFIYQQKIGYLQDTLKIFHEVVDFIKKHLEFAFFISIDNKQYTSFSRLFKELFNQENLCIIKENELRENSIEYKLSLIIDTKLNIKRKSK